jgi:hypothetical protein
LLSEKVTMSFETLKLLVPTVEVRLGSTLVFLRLTLEVASNMPSVTSIELGPEELLAG